MSRTTRQSPGGVAYHVMNRCVAGLTLFEDDDDYAAFERVMAEAKLRFPAMRLCAYCLMPNHFHLVLWPGEDGLLSRFMQWLTMTHTQRWHAHRHSAGRGHLYQSRFKSFPIEQDRHFLSVCRYVERNALRAKLVERAEAWRWGSLFGRTGVRRGHERKGGGTGPGVLADRDEPAVVCDGWPVDRPRGWGAIVNRPQRQSELDALRQSLRRGSPFGSDAWSVKIAASLGLEHSLRPRGRPRKRG